MCLSKLQKIAHAKVFEKSIKECVVKIVASILRFSLKPMTISIAKSSCRLVIDKKNQLIKEEKCFLCREVGHKTMDCLSKKKLMREQKSKSKLSVNHMTMQKSEQKEPHAAPCVKKLLIISSSSLPGDFFAEEVLVALYIL